MVRLLVCGSRGFGDERLFLEVMEKVVKKLGSVDVVLEGGALGADRLGRKWGLAREIVVLTYEAEWSRYGRAAGYRRNIRMLEEGKPTHVVAFYAGERTPGTSNMVKIARAKGVLVCEIGVKND